MRVAIVGAGMSGLCLGIALQRAGVDDFTIYEKAAEVGGTWRENTYPGLECDIPSRYYQYSFAPNPDWSSCYSPGGEIQDYFRGVADRYGLRRHIRFGTEVTAARWTGERWQVTTDAGDEDTADVLVSACGVLHHPRIPDLPGRDDFEGALFHSARWDHTVDLRGKRVGVVGTGSTGVQIVTALPGVARHVALFQRTAQWIFPMHNWRYRAATRRRLRRLPALERPAYRFWQKYIEWGIGRAVVQPGLQRHVFGVACRLNLRRVRDRELRRRLTPTYDPMCKRIVVSWGFYDAVQQPNVDVVADAIERIEPRGIRTADGRLHELDAIVLATGFDSHAYLRPIELVGEDGVTLEDAWREGVRAYRTVALPGFPNFFMMMGPHSPVGNQSLVPIAEDQAAYIVRLVDLLRRGDAVAVVPTAEATDRYNDELRAAMGDTVWTTGCDSWYLGKDGLPELWPFAPERHREMLRAPAPAELEVRRAPAAAPAAG